MRGPRPAKCLISQRPRTATSPLKSARSTTASTPILTSVRSSSRTFRPLRPVSPISPRRWKAAKWPSVPARSPLHQVMRASFALFSVARSVATRSSSSAATSPAARATPPLVPRSLTWSLIRRVWLVRCLIPTSSPCSTRHQVRISFSPRCPRSPRQSSRLKAQQSMSLILLTDHAQRLQVRLPRTGLQ